MDTPRVHPLAPEELTDEQQAFLAPFTNKRGQFPNIFGTLVRHMDLTKAWSGFGLYTMRDSQIDPVLREVLILRTACLIGSDYEWHQHQKIAERLGMSDTDFSIIKRGDEFADLEKNLMLQCANDLVQTHALSDETWHNMNAAFDLTYVLDSIMTVGAYTALGMALNSCGVQIEDKA
ncbi:MAG: carboxymuconolactone decarboxylase family protein [Pseudomonadota bacterium]